METPNLLTIGIGNKPKEKLKAIKCEVIKVETEYIEKAKINKAIFYLKHPDKDEVKISAVTLLKQKKDKKEIVSYATWINLDKESKFEMESPLAQLLRFYEVSNLSEMVGKKVDTESDNEGYLTIRAY